MMKGSYILLIEVEDDRKIEIGKLGKLKFQKGFYAYVGSAMAGIESRVKRHLRAEKRLHWHIDYLLEGAVIRGVICMESERKEECEIAAKFEKRFMSVGGFGCSDCGCRSHLFFSPSIEDLRREFQ